MKKLFYTRIQLKLLLFSVIAQNNKKVTHMISWLRSLPIWVLIADLWFIVAINLTQSLDKPPSKLTASSNLPVAPDIAFNWLQVAVNTGMAIILSWALIMLLRIYRQAKEGTLTWQASSICALLICLAFSLPACYGLIMQITHVVTGTGSPQISFSNVRYLIIALLLPYPCPLALITIINSATQKRSQFVQDAPE